MVVELSKHKPNILVIGDLMIDNYLIGNCSRISPEAPVQIIDINEEYQVLGGAGNVVNNLKSLGAEVSVMSIIGDCQVSNQLKELFESIAVNTSDLITEKKRFSSKKTRIISSQQQVVRYDVESSCDIAEGSEKELIKRFQEKVRKFDLIILSDYGKGVLTKTLTRKVIEISNNNSIKVIVDPKGADYSKYYSAFLLTPNKKEIMDALGIKINSDKALFEALQTQKNQFNLNISLITLSEDGIAILDDQVRKHPTVAKEVFDVTGAGDTVIASLGYALAVNSDIDSAVKFANLAAGVVVGKVGSATVSFDEISAYESSLHISGCEEHIKNIDQFLPILDNLRMQKKQIIFTNGCFDILHVGHVKYLEKAKSLGGILIVGLNTDNSISRLKGETRPVNTLDDRACVIAGLESVDYVIPFEEDTPLELIKIISPDILVKGADYKGKKVVGEELVSKLVLIDFIDGKSSTETIKKIQSL